MKTNPTAFNKVAAILSRREDISIQDAKEWVKEALDWVEMALERGEDAESVWQDETGLEPDYLMEILI